LKRVILLLLGLIVGLGLAGAIGGFVIYQKFSADLPEVSELAGYDPPVVTRVHAGDGRLLAEFATENRVYVPITSIPKVVSDAFLSAEDKTFYQHPGIDVPGILQAVITNIVHMGSDRRPVGASTITQQVAKNFLLTNELSFRRKIREIILALRIEKAYSKDRILELYLNEIYLGFGSYGVASAAINYFNKSLDELTVAEAAFLAALPKAPNNYNPISRHAEALDRRNWVIGRMLEDGHISGPEAVAALSEPLAVSGRAAADVVSADYFAEEVRRELVQRFGEKSLYEGGLSVRTSLDPALQAIADKALRDGMQRYDRKYGWRGPITNLDPGDGWVDRLKAVAPPPGIRDWRLAIALEVGAEQVKLGFADGSLGTLPLAEMKWARPSLGENHVGPEVKKPADVLKPGDVAMVEPVEKDGDVAYPAGTYGLRQIPAIGAALIAMDPHTGRVLAMVGGWSYAISEFNRATQALRQPGSSFKPFVYMTALENGYTPSTIILDAPIIIDQGPGLPKWQPENYSNDFLGPSTMRVGIEKSRNLMTVRLAQAVGMQKVVDLVSRFGVIDNMPPLLSMSLGAGDTTLLRLATAYSEIVNGGRKVGPSFIDRVQDRTGKTIFKTDDRPCDGCQVAAWQDGMTPPAVPDDREQVVDPQTAYQMVHMLEGVVQWGTGTAVRAVGKPLAGKTGTSNDSKDVWFMGFAPDLTVGVFFGFDQPRSLGGKETGGVVAAPVFRDFMMAALADKPAVPFRVPTGIRMVRVDAHTGQRATAASEKVIYEAFKPGTEPTGQQQPMIEGVGVVPDTSLDGGTGAGATGGTTGGTTPLPTYGGSDGGTGGLY